MSRNCGRWAKGYPAPPGPLQPVIGLDWNRRSRSPEWVIALRRKTQPQRTTFKTGANGHEEPQHSGAVRGALRDS